MTNTLIFIVIISLWIIGSALVMLMFRRRGVDALAPGTIIVKQSAPPSFLIWIEEEWRLTCFLLGIIEHYTDPIPRWTIDTLTPAKAELSITAPDNGDKANAASRIADIDIISSRLEDISRWIGADGHKVLDTNRTSVSVRFSFGEDAFLTKTVEWDASLRADEAIPDRVPLGIDDTESIVSVPIRGGHTLIAGNTGSGKGSVIWSIVGGLCGRSDVEIHGVDLKGGVEFNLGRQVFHSVSTDKDEFADTIDFIFDIMVERQQRVKALETRDMPIDDIDRMIVLIIDEALDIADMDKDKEYKDTVQKFDEILRKARATGIVVIAALQNPNVSEFKWSKKFTQTIILRMSAAQQGGALGYDSLEVLDMSKIPQSIRGVALVRSETGVYTPAKVFYPNDEVVKTLPSAVLTSADLDLYNEEVISTH